MFYWKDGRVYEGLWKDGKQHGIGVFTSKDGQVRKGEWQFGKKIAWLE
jgi:hypothetical protein